MMLVLRSSAAPVLRILLTFFFFSGASSLMFEAIFTRLLTYTFGNTAQAVSTVLAAFLGGLALGALLLGRWVERRRASLWTYGVLELLVGFYCLFIPKLLALVTWTYVALYNRLQLGPTALIAVRFALAALVILVPTVLMGGTLPVLARYVAAQGSEFEPGVSRLYAWNTLGAALGTLVCTFLLIPSVGVRGSIWFACGINLVIFLGVAALASPSLRSSSRAVRELSVRNAGAQPTARRSQGIMAFVVLGAFITGAVALAYEVIWTHVLAFLVGNTAYAFGVMLFTFLCGLGWGAWIVSRHLRRPALWSPALAASQFVLGLVIFATLPLWTRIPDILSNGLTGVLVLDIVSVGLPLALRIVYLTCKIYRRPPGVRLPWARVAELAAEILLPLLALVIVPRLWLAHPDFLWKHVDLFFFAGEFARFSCAFYFLIGPAVLLGLSFPLLLNLFSHSAERVGASVGGIYAANTVGAILGSVLTGFGLLPRFGSFVVLRGAATANAALGLLFALALVPLKRNRKLILAVPVSIVVLAFWLGQGGWDARRTSCGSYVYFQGCQSFDRVVYLREDSQGGLTSVVERGPSRTLLSNGKFQGNNTSAVPEQIRFALVPALFTRRFDRALVIGLGTGNTLRTVARFPFKRIDVVELAPHIVEAARLWFEDVNGRVFDRDPRVSLSIADGRNFLLLSREPFDLITIEISSIWISGEADLYNKEFYELCRAHLSENGVLQQWVQIHHMRTQDLLVILNTAAQVFPHVAFFLNPRGSQQGLLIASASPLECDYRQIKAFDADPGIRQELRFLNLPSISSLLGELVLDDNALRRATSLLPRLSGLPADFTSTDFYPYLEYQTPKGNTLPYDTVLVNRNFVVALRPPPLPEDLPIRNLPSQSERQLILGYVTEHQGGIRAAAEHIPQLDGQRELVPKRD